MRHIAAALCSAAERDWLRAPLSSQASIALATAMAAVLLSACTVATPPVVSADGGSIPSGQSITLASPSPDAAPQEHALHAALGEEFAKQGYALSENGAYIIEYSIAERSASVGIAYEPPQGQTAQPEIASPDRIDKRILRECNAQRLRINMVAYPTAQSGSTKRVSGEMDDCAFSANSVQTVVTAMVDALSAG